MKKVLFIAILAMCMVGCCKKADNKCCEGEKTECCQKAEYDVSFLLDQKLGEQDGRQRHCRTYGNIDAAGRDNHCHSQRNDDHGERLDQQIPHGIDVDKIWRNKSVQHYQRNQNDQCAIGTDDILRPLIFQWLLPPSTPFAIRFMI